MKVSNAMLILGSNLGTEVVRLVVGEECELITVHKRLICSSSDFFEKAFNGGFKEAKENEIKPPEDKPTTVQVYVRWLYTKILPRSGFDFTMVDYLELYYFAAKICCTELKDITMDEFQDHLLTDFNPWGISTEMIREAFDRTNDCNLRKFCIAQLTHTNACLSNENELHRLFRKAPDSLTEYLQFQSVMRQNSLTLDSNPSTRGGSDGYPVCFFHVRDANHDCKSKSNAWITE